MKNKLVLFFNKEYNPSDDTLMGFPMIILDQVIQEMVMGDKVTAESFNIFLLKNGYLLENKKVITQQTAKGDYPLREILFRVMEIKQKEWANQEKEAKEKQEKNRKEQEEIEKKKKN